MDNQSDEPININSVIHYIKEHFIGLFLLIFAVFIIYLVDHINNINAFIITTLNITGVQIPGVPNTGAVSNIKKEKRKKK